MSGLEVAGVVLGAFPLAISALERYREVATRLGLFYKIKLQHKKCMDDLSCQQLYLTRHLRQLILPLAVNYDDAKINELLANPAGPGWRDEAVAGMLEDRLKDSYELYLSYVQGMQHTMEKLNRELSVDVEGVQSQMQHPSVSKIRLGTKESRHFQLYRVKFSNGEAARKQLFGELQEYNTKLEKLLDSSDKDAQLIRKVAGARSKAVDATICSFWIQAARLFQLLATAWNCHCHQQHYAKLQLQHRTSKKPDFTILFETETEGSEPLPWVRRRARIAEGHEQPPASQDVTSLEKREPSPKLGGLTKSAFKAAGQVKRGHVEFLAPPPSITISGMGMGGDGTLAGANLPILSLCSSLEGPERNCCGYLLSDEDCRYYVYTEAHGSEAWGSSVTLDDMLRGHMRCRPTRRQRYAISLILASSFVQLLETPWLPESLSKSDVVFFKDGEGTSTLKLNEPHVTRQFNETKGGKQSNPPTSLSRSLDQLGILLLELCFGDVLEEQPCRQQWRAGESEAERMAFDVMAARDWQEYVVEEAGLEYSEAVSWCLGGNRSVPSGPGRWREEMMRKVVQPLQRCRDYLMIDVKS